MDINKMTLLDVIINQTQQSANALAILAPDRQHMSYESLLRHVLQSSKMISQLGIKRNDRISLVLPNGPEMVTAFFAVTSIATCAPLNPAYSIEEFKFYFSDLNVRLVIVGDGLNTMAIEAARQLGVRVILLKSTENMKAGEFEFVGATMEQGGQPSLSYSDDVALVLHTSGTTGKPKIVALTHDNICTSANNIASVLSLGKTDRCLNVMPLFHVHGLVGAVLASLTSGGSVVCTPGFNASSFLKWLDEFSISWYTAVPTMHQAVFAQWESKKMEPIKSTLRFIRSCSSALAPQVAEALETAFGKPVVEAYGMTEAAHQMAVNPLPPGNRKSGSVGKEAGCNIGIMDDKGNLVPTKVVGEIVVRGRNVISGYENNPKANENSFHNGWFRTGDQGYLDEEGYLFINGRIKEIINRGGEKISPREVDEVLLRHPAIAQAATFAMPHPTLGEDIAAIIVMRKGMAATEKELRLFAAKEMAYYKVPSKVIFADEIPKGPTGKVQRVGLAEKLGLISAEIATANLRQNSPRPQSTIEQIVAAIWGDVFELPELGIDEDFFALGGNSIQAMQIIARIHEKTGVDLQFAEFFSAPTIADMAALITERKS